MLIFCKHMIYPHKIFIFVSISKLFLQYDECGNSNFINKSNSIIRKICIYYKSIVQNAIQLF